MYALPGMPGAVAGWIFVLALAAGLVWRATNPVRPRLRIAAGFALAALALFWIMLARRQLLGGMPDWWTRLGLPALIRAGGFPPEFPWNPGMPAGYHHGVDLLLGLLAPPFGPDLAFMNELLGVYGVVSLAFIVVTALLRRASGFAVLIAAPLLLTSGAWTLVTDPPSIVEAPVPAGIPAAGLRASLMDIYWPPVELPYSRVRHAPPNIWKPAFTLSYALTLVVLMHAARAKRRSWPATLTLAALIGFLGLTSTSLAPIALVLWAGLEAIHLIKSRRAGSLQRSHAVRPASGLALAALLLLAGGFSSLILGGSVSSGLALGTSEFFGGWRLLGTLDRLPGGVGILGLGPLAVAGVALVLARRDRVVLALAAGTSSLLLASLLLSYEPVPWDLVRLEGHARNFALFALLIALGTRLTTLPTARWRYAAGAAVVALVTWPTIIVPARTIGFAIGNGVELANAQQMQRAPGAHFKWRYKLKSIPSDRIAAYIRNNTSVDTRVFSPHPRLTTFTTGRPNASGFAGLVHLQPSKGPEYGDVLRYLEPGAVGRRGFEYIHATDAWIDSLPDQAVERLNDPNLFELLVRDGSESLYRVLPAFLTLDAPPEPASYEALRQAVPASATVFLPRGFKTRTIIHAASVLSHARLLGASIDPERMHLRTPWHIKPLGDRVPDFVLTSAQFVPWMFPPASRQPIWWNDETAVYALDGSFDQIVPPPPQAEPLPFSVRVSDLRAEDGRAVFTATFDDGAPDLNGRARTG